MAEETKSTSNQNSENQKTAWPMEDDPNLGQVQTTSPNQVQSPSQKEEQKRQQADQGQPAPGGNL